ncbi:unnamed protein product [Rotaria sordida]|nr:unnamed protein product [Rotaria sordida]
MVRCNSDNVTCSIAQTICVNNTRCQQPVCYPMALANIQICPPSARPTNTTTTTTSRTNSTTIQTTTKTATTTSTRTRKNEPHGFLSKT